MPHAKRVSTSSLASTVPGSGGLPSLWTDKQFDTRFLTIKRQGVVYDSLIHEAGVQCLLHAKEHGDARNVDRLFSCLAQGYRAEGLRVWVGTFSPIRWNGNGQVGILKRDAKGYVDYDVTTADTTPFWTLNGAKERTIQTITLSSILATIGRMKAWLDNVNDKGEVLNDKGEVTKKISGNVAEIKSYLNRIDRVKKPDDTAPDEVMKSESTLIPAAGSAREAAASA